MSFSNDHLSPGRVGFGAWFIFLLSALLFLLLSIPAESADRVLSFGIEIVDESNGWPVPLVELKTTSNLRFVSDNAGKIAIDTPELVGRDVWFEVKSDGYELPADGFGFRGRRVHIEQGKSLQLKLKRTSIASRVGRLTGSGLFAESQKLGLHPEWQDSSVVGCDSVHVARWKGRYFWLWGDTTLHNYPLGIFHTLGGTTSNQSFLFTKPPLAPHFDYFADKDQRPYGIAPMKGEGPTWLMGLTTVFDEKENKEQLVASYSKVRNHLEVYEWGLCRWDDSISHFIHHKTIWTKTSDSLPPPPLPNGHAIKTTSVDHKTKLFFGDPFPFLECEPTFQSWEDPSTWKLLKSPSHATTAGLDVQKVIPHRGDIGFHRSKGKWVAIFTELYGKPSPFGEIWYAESDQPTGPWTNALKVLSHQNYSFYNPVLHLSPDDEEPCLWFEGTYTTEFADRPEPTPRYNYNQILYRINPTDFPLHPK